MVTKRKHVTKQGFCKILWRKLHLRRSLLLVLIHFCWAGGGRGLGFGCGHFFEFEWKEEGVGASWFFLLLGWALIRGWALIWINTVCAFIKSCREKWLQLIDMTLTLQDSGEHDTKPYNLNILSKNIKVLLFRIFLILFPSACKYAIP